MTEVQTKQIEETIGFVKNTLQEAEGGHDWFHTQRVFRNALHIGEEENADLFIVGLGALLHDIADSKFYDGDEDIGPQMAQDFMNKIKVSKSVQQEVIRIIQHISFKGGNFKQGYKSIELDVVQDADRLDALGAIGIARCFNYGGFKNRKLYDPEILPDLKMDKETYKKSEAPTINHFYEKLLLLKDRMNTNTGKQLAEERHNYMENFLEQFYREWNMDIKQL
ncbi:HD domain-containing protein [Aquimarina sp. ERC-38]|uniref:HD domain-containing protein n=1 Tax=Aquimarina sp. ERC-38 TaxID=2949996 RepID=UPI0022473834|nr:HD domain-containing protein [Aquimarina sp. ERC-38]UZO81911.1 HD domain-containing protein [Aquimarina sp. ERC-38]